jgi:hypothetical protein
VAGYPAGDSVFTQTAPAKRQKTAAERKVERKKKEAELADADPDQPWALQVCCCTCNRLDNSSGAND